MTTAVLENYQVMDETQTEAPAPVKPGKRRNSMAIPNGDDEGPASPTPDFRADDDKGAEEFAAALQETVNKAAAKGLEIVLENGTKLMDEKVARFASTMEGKAEKLIQYMESQSKLYAKPQNLVLHVRLGELPPVRLTSRAAKVLPKLIAQAKIGQAGGNWPLMVGPTGSGKTVAALQVAQTLGVSFHTTNFTEGAGDSWLWGRQTPTGFVPGAFWSAFSKGGVFLADEMDAANDNVLLGMNTALANGEAYNPINGEHAKRHADFVFIGAANTNGKGGTGAYGGRSRLDGATLNRFTMFGVSYDTDLERELCPDFDLLEKLWSARVKLTERNSADVISSRCIKNAYLQAQAGFSLSEILTALRMRMDKANWPIFDDIIADNPDTSSSSKKKGGK